MQAIMQIWLDIMTTVFALPPGTENLLGGLVGGLSGLIENLSTFFEAMREIIGLLGGLTG